MTGAPFRSARSITLQIFSACASRQRAAEHGEVLGEDVDQPAVDPAVAGDHAVAGNDLLVQAEVGGAVGDEAVELDEAALVEQEVEPLARGELALLVLLRHARGSPALFGEGLAVMELVEELSGVGHGGRDIRLRRPAERVSAAAPSDRRGSRAARPSIASPCGSSSVRWDDRTGAAPRPVPDRACGTRRA